MKDWTVIGYYSDNEQPYAGHVNAASPEAAKVKAVELAEVDSGCDLIVVGVIEGNHDVY